MPDEEEEPRKALKYSALCKSGQYIRQKITRFSNTVADSLDNFTERN